jgi:hypothetical protein
VSTSLLLEGYAQLYGNVQDISFDTNIYNANTFPSPKMISDMLYVSNCWSAYQNKTICRLAQISEYNWLNHKHFQDALERLQSLDISCNSLFEREVVFTNKIVNKTTNSITIPSISVNGKIDIFDKKSKNIYEIKCTQELSKEHYIQLALYMFIYEMEHQSKKKRKKPKPSGMKYLLYNVNTDNLCEIVYNENISHIFFKIVQEKQKQQQLQNDETFLSNIRHIQEKESF